MNTQPVAGLHVSVVHALLSLHGAFGVYTQPVAGLQVSVVHALPSLQTIGVCWHPRAGSQTSVVQALPSSQLQMFSWPVLWFPAASEPAVLQTASLFGIVNPAAWLIEAPRGSAFTTRSNCRSQANGVPAGTTRAGDALNTTSLGSVPPALLAVQATPPQEDEMFPA